MTIRKAGFDRHCLFFWSQACAPRKHCFKQHVTGVRAKFKTPLSSWKLMCHQLKFLHRSCRIGQDEGRLHRNPQPLTNLRHLSLGQLGAVDVSGALEKSHLWLSTQGPIWSCCAGPARLMAQPGRSFAASGERAGHHVWDSFPAREFWFQTLWTLVLLTCVPPSLGVNIDVKLLIPNPSGLTQ